MPPPPYAEDVEASAPLNITDGPLPCPRQPSFLPEGLSASRTAYGISQCAWLSAILLICLTAITIVLLTGPNHDRLVDRLLETQGDWTNSTLTRTTQMLVSLTKSLCPQNSTIPFCAGALLYG